MTQGSVAAPGVDGAAWRLLHAPPVAAHNNAPIVLAVDFLHPQLVAEARVHYRTSAVAAWQSVRVELESPGYVARLPAQPPAVRWVEYWITVLGRDGAARDSFGTEARPHVLVVSPTPDLEQELRELADNRGHRLEFVAGGEFTDFGSRPDPSGAVCSAPGPDPRCHDWWYSVYGTVSYHFFRVVRSITVRVERVEGVGTRVSRQSGRPEETTVGLVAATPTVELRLTPRISMSLSGILGANQNSVRVGGGGGFTFGVGTPTRVELAFSGILDYGISISGWLRWFTVRDTPMGAGIELTNQPDARDAALGVRLLFEIARPIGSHVLLLLRGGYGARRLDAGGFSGGGYLQLAF